MQNKLLIVLGILIVIFNYPISKLFVEFYPLHKRMGIKVVRIITILAGASAIVAGFFSLI